MPYDDDDFCGDELDIEITLEPDEPIDYMAEFTLLAHVAEADDESPDEAKELARHILLHYSGEARH